MREKTRFLKQLAKDDIRKMYYHNNSKRSKMTAEQIEKARKAKQDFYSKKWNELLADCDTKAQKETCLDVLHRVKNII